jgi:DNA-binding LytR/AlgR family response regulator
MSKLYFNTRDDLICIDTDLVAAVKADGNYSKVFYINGRIIHLNTGITKMEEILKSLPSKTNRFIRLGRSCIVNHAFLFKIEPLKQQLILSDGYKCDLKVPLPKQTLKTYKDALEKRSDVIKQKKNKHLPTIDS